MNKYIYILLVGAIITAMFKQDNKLFIQIHRLIHIESNRQFGVVEFFNLRADSINTYFGNCKEIWLNKKYTYTLISNETNL